MIVVAGFPRSGTTLLYNMLRTTVRGYTFFDREVAFREAVKISDKFISKKPNDAKRIKNIKKYQEAKIILCVRDLRSVLCSKMEHAPNRYKIDWDKQVKTSHTRGVVGFKDNGLLKLSKRMRSNISSVDFICKYEKLVENPDLMQKKLGEVFDFKYEGLFSGFWKSDIPFSLKKQLNGVRPVDTKGVKKWKEHPERIKEQFGQCPKLFDELIFWGYEKDKKWIISI